MIEHDLRGRLERVRIIGIGNQGSAHGKVVRKGKLTDIVVNVTHGAEFLGEDCLVRFDLSWGDSYDRNIGNFVTSRLYYKYETDDFAGLPGDEFVLCARWRDYMQKSHRIPNLDEINEFYDPGDLAMVFYISRHPRSGSNPLILPSCCTPWIRDMYPCSDYWEFLHEKVYRICDPAKSVRMVLFKFQYHFHQFIETLKHRANLVVLDSLR